MAIELDVSGLSCRRGGRLLFANLSVKLAAGQALALQGANGVGKTSLLRQMAGFLPSDGAICLHVDGQAIRDDEQRGKFIGWLGTQEAIKPSQTVQNHLAFFARLQGAAVSSNTPRAFGAALLERFGLQGDWLCGRLSAGQRRRLGLARLVLLARPLWLMDEPLALLDAAGQALAQTLMAGHLATGGMVIAAGHEPLEIPCLRLPLVAAA